MRTLIHRTPPALRIGVLVATALAAIWFIAEHDATLDPALGNSTYDIVDFELARTPDQASAILDDWGPAGRNAAKDALAIDFGLLVAYSVFLALACGWVAEALENSLYPRLARIGWWLARLTLVAGLLDAIENTALLAVLRGYDSGNISSGLTLLAAVAAGLKFVILLAAAGYLVVGLLTLIRHWLRSLQSVSGGRL